MSAPTSVELPCPPAPDAEDGGASNPEAVRAASSSHYDEEPAIGVTTGGAGDESSESVSATIGVGEPTEGAGSQNGASGGGNDALQAWNHIWKRVKGFVPFFVILNAKLLHDHSVGLLVLLGLTATFLYANDLLKDCVSERDRGRRTLIRLCWLLLFLITSVLFLFYVFDSQRLYRSLYMFPPTLVNYDIWNLVWCVVIADYVVKYATVCVKAIVTALPRSVLPARRRGAYYLLIEHLSQCYRLLPPIPCWIMFLTDNQAAKGTSDYYNGVLVVLYVVFKALASWYSVKALTDAWRKFHTCAAFGSMPTAEQLATAGPICPICHDEVRSPVRLDCSHVFCEDCVALWFDRERTCPMCRTKVVEDPAWRDGSTGTYLQLC